MDSEATTKSEMACNPLTEIEIGTSGLKEKSDRYITTYGMNLK
jgi:hypothetical protein